MVKVASISRDQHAKDLSQSIEDVRQAQMAIEGLKRGVKLARARFNLDHGAVVDPQTLALYERYYHMRSEEVRRLTSSLVTLNEEVERRRATLRESLKELKTYEKRREQLIEEHHQAQRTAEGRRIDEFAIRGFAHGEQ